VFSAGTNPKGLHPTTIEVMRELDIDISVHTSKHLNNFLEQKFDYVITVCDSAKQQCPIFPGAASMDWGLDDPADASPETQLQAFRKIREEIRLRINLFLSANRR
jgi:arsenate reductase